MRLWLVVQPARGDQRDVAVEVDPSCPTQKLVDALAEHVGVDGGQVAAYSRSLGRWLDGGREVAEAGLRSGDRLVLAAAASGRGRPERNDGAPFELRVIGGPVAGTTVALAPGEHLVGRGKGCTVHLDDPSLSREHIRLQVGADTVEIEDAGSSNGTFLDGEPSTPGTGSSPVGWCSPAGRS